MDDINRKGVAALIKHLKTSKLKGSRSKVPDEELAALLASRPGGETLFKRAEVNLLFHGRKTATPEQIAIIKAVVEDLSPDFDIQSKFPFDLSSLFFGKPPPVGIGVGDNIDNLKDALSGLWRLFYVSPVNRQGEFEEEVRGMIAFLRPAPASSKQIEMTMISSHTYWSGCCYLNQNHLYVILNELDKQAETAFMVWKRPVSDIPFVTGIIVALDRGKDFDVRPVAATLCFGAKWSGTLGDGKSPDVARRVSTIEKRVQSGLHTTEEERDLLRQSFCDRSGAALTWEEFEKKEPRLYARVQRLRINDATIGALKALHVNWAS